MTFALGFVIHLMDAKVLLNLLVDIDGKERVLLSLNGLAVGAVAVVALVAVGALGG